MDVPFRSVALVAGLTCLAFGCGKGTLGPAESHLILVPVSPAARSPGGLPVVRPVNIERDPGLAVARLTADGFASEMVRSVYLAKQLVRTAEVSGQRHPEAVRAAAALPLGLVIETESGAAPAAALSRGLAFERWLGAPEEHPLLTWTALPATLTDDKALVQTLSGRLAVHAASFVTGEQRGSAPLVEAFGMAMEVISREWRVSRGAGTALPTTAGTMKQRTLFADIRENHAVMSGEDRRDLRTPAELLADPKVIATVIYRLAQTRAVGNKVGPPEIYRPFFSGSLPEGVSGAQVLGPIRNYVAKLLTAWSRAILESRPPVDGADLVEAYSRLFPEERREVLRIFLVTTFAATVKPGGISRRPEEATAAVAEVSALTEEILAGKRTLKDAVTSAASSAGGGPRP
jgi:hypothetical protein